MKKVFIIVLLVLISPSIVSAHPGRLDSSGCHTCRTNCSKWGLSTGEYHCHNGSSSKSSTKNTIVNKVVTKSKNVNIKEIYINGESIDIKDNMSYTTNEDIIIINAIKEDDKASIIYDKEIRIDDGENNISIKVIAEDTSIIKIYNINIIKLSNDTSIEVFINGNSINFDDKLEVYSNNIDISYKAGSKNANVNIKGDYNKLKYGDNDIIFEVTAESGLKKEYKLIVTRKYKSKLFNSIASINLKDNNMNYILGKILSYFIESLRTK